MITLNFKTQKEQDDFLAVCKSAIITSVVPIVTNPPLFSYDFSTKLNGILTNEYAHWNLTDPKSKVSPDWDMDSGSLFVKEGWGYSGVPDDKSVDALSANGNNSAVFRLTTRRKDFKDVSVKFQLKNHALTSTPTTPIVDWDGVHVFLRYQTEYQLYYASINRRDQKAVIKKKTPGGPSNDGTYYELSQEVPHKWTFDSLQNVEARVRNVGQTVEITLLAEGVEIVKAIDDGKLGGPPILLAGATGIRADNCEFIFNSFMVTAF